MLQMKSYKVGPIRAQRPLQLTCTFLILLFYWFDHLVPEIVPNPQREELKRHNQNLKNYTEVVLKICHFLEQVRRRNVWRTQFWFLYTLGRSLRDFIVWMNWSAMKRRILIGSLLVRNLNNLIRHA